MTDVNCMGLNFRTISKYLGLVVLLLGGAMVIPTVMALCIGETECVRAFGLCGAAIAVLGGIFFLPQRHYNPNFHAGVREGFFIMAVSWKRLITKSMLKAIEY